MDKDSKKDILMIMKLASELDLRNAAYVNKVNMLAESKGVLQTKYGKIFLERINQGITETTTCMFCNSLKPDNGIICNRCMNTIKNNLNPGEHKASAKQEEQKRIYCRTCGKEVSSAESICNYCHKRADEGYEYCACCGNKVPLPKFSKKNKKWILIIVGIFIIIGMLSEMIESNTDDRANLDNSLQASSELESNQVQGSYSDRDIVDMNFVRNQITPEQILERYQEVWDLLAEKNGDIGFVGIEYEFDNSVGSNVDCHIKIGNNAIDYGHILITANEEGYVESMMISTNEDASILSEMVHATTGLSSEEARQLTKELLTAAQKRKEEPDIYENFCHEGIYYKIYSLDEIYLFMDSSPIADE